MASPTRRLALSSSSVGAFGTSHQFEVIWADALELLHSYPTHSAHLDTIEIIGFTHQLEGFLQLVERWGFTAGIHGRTGTSRSEPLGLQLLMLPINAFIVPQSVLLGELSQRPQVRYLLNHDLLFQVNQYTPQAVVKTLNHGSKTYYIENHVGTSMPQTTELIRNLRNQQIDAQIMYDIYHSLRTQLPTRDYTHAWEYIIAELDQLAHLGFCNAIHLPIGTNLSDSVDLEKITTQMWENLTEILNRHNLDVVLEDQQTGFSKVLPIHPKSHSRRNIELVRLFAQTGII